MERCVHTQLSAFEYIWQWLFLKKKKYSLGVLHALRKKNLKNIKHFGLFITKWAEWLLSCCFVFSLRALPDCPFLAPNIDKSRKEKKKHLCWPFWLYITRWRNSSSPCTRSLELPLQGVSSFFSPIWIHVDSLFCLLSFLLYRSDYSFNERRMERKRKVLSSGRQRVGSSLLRKHPPSLLEPSGCLVFILLYIYIYVLYIV